MTEKSYQSPFGHNERNGMDKWILLRRAAILVCDKRPKSLSEKKTRFE